MFACVWVEQYPDLTLNASDISFSSETPITGENVTINATIHNIGEADANNASILFYDGEPASEGCDLQLHHPYRLLSADNP